MNDNPRNDLIKWIKEYGLDSLKDGPKIITGFTGFAHDKATQMMINAPRAYGKGELRALWAKDLRASLDQKRKGFVVLDDMEDTMGEKENTEILKIEIEATRGGYVVDIGCEDFIYPTAEAMVRDLLAYLTSDDKREFERAFLVAHPKGKAL